MTGARRPLRGDEAELYEALAGELVGVLQRIVNTDPATIDDACQFAWLQLLRCQPRRDTVRAWLITVARREAIRLHRIRRRCESISTGVPAPGQHPEPASTVDAFALAIDLDEALTALASLPERQRNLYALKVLGFSYEEICRITGDSYTAVNRHLVRAYALVRRARARG